MHQPPREPSRRVLEHSGQKKRAAQLGLPRPLASAVYDYMNEEARASMRAVSKDAYAQYGGGKTCAQADAEWCRAHSYDKDKQCTDECKPFFDADRTARDFYELFVDPVKKFSVVTRDSFGKWARHIRRATVYIEEPNRKLDVAEVNYWSWSMKVGNADFDPQEPSLPLLRSEAKPRFVIDFKGWAPSETFVDSVATLDRKHVVAHFHRNRGWVSLSIAKEHRRAFRHAWNTLVVDELFQCNEYDEHELDVYRKHYVPQPAPAPPAPSTPPASPEDVKRDAYGIKTSTHQVGVTGYGALKEPQRAQWRKEQADPDALRKRMRREAIQRLSVDSSDEEMDEYDCTRKPELTNRPEPPFSANHCPPGIIKSGNDGLRYVNEDGRWVPAADIMDELD
jgi:hypothetical protein